MLLDKEKEFDMNNPLSNLKSSIKSNIIKSMLIDEDLQFKNKIIISKNIKSSENKNKNNKKITSNKGKINLNKNNRQEKESNNQIIIQKIKPKSKTIINLMNENINKTILKSIPKNEVINNKKESTKKIIINRKKSPYVKKVIKNKEIKPKINNIIDISKSMTQQNIYKSNNKIRTKSLSYNYENLKNIINIKIYKSKDKILCQSEEKAQTERIKSNISIENLLNINIKQNNKLRSNKQLQLNKKVPILMSDMLVNSNEIINPNNEFSEKNIQDFEIFLNSENFEENQGIENTLNLFKKGNKYIKKYIHLPIYHHYSNEELIKEILFKDILSFLLPYERYLFAKTNKNSLIKYLKLKGSETENLLDNYNLKKEIIEKKLNKNKNIKITKINFFKNEKILKIFKLLNEEIYLEIFNDKTKTPNDNIIFVYKLFFLLIKGTDKLIQLNNKIFWEKICDYFINHTNEFNQSDLQLGDLIKAILEQKLNFSDENIKKIYDIINQIDIRQIKPITFSKISPTTSQFCCIIEYFLEFFGIFENNWSPLENEYIIIQYKIKNLIKKINKIGLYIVNLKYRNKNDNN